MRLKLLPKFVLLLVLLSVVPAAIVGLRTININREGMQAAILELHTHLASTLADSVQDFLGSLDREIQYVLKTLSAQMSWSDRQSVLQALLDTNENFVAVSVVSRQGQEILKAYNPMLEKNPRLLSRAADETFRKFWKDARRSELSSAYFADDGSPRMDIIYPLGQDHCLFTTVSLQSLWNRITHTRIASTGYAFLVNEKGEIIAHPTPELALKRTPATELPIVTQVMKAVTVGSSEYAHPQSKKLIVGAYAPIKTLNWGVIIQQDKSEAFVSVARMRRQAFWLILISLGAASFLAFYIARGLTKPLFTLTQAARQIAQKDFSVRVSVKTRDELRDLAETFNRMTTELERYDKMQVDKIVEEKTKTESVIFSIADGILMTDREGRLQIANTQAKEILGLSDANWHNESLWKFVTSETLKNAFEEIIHSTSQNVAREVDLSTADTARYFMLSASEVVTPEKKEKIGLVTVMRNITLEKELEKMKDDFLHTITHDLRNPMTSIRGFLKFLLDGVGGPVNDQQKKMLETMDRASTRLLGLINDILDIAKLESGRMVLTLSDTDLRQVVKHTVEIAEGQALRKNIKLVTEAPEDLPHITADTELIERVFSNLVSNALKFTPESGTIVVRLLDQGPSVRAEVIDTGEGIPKEYLSRIFDKFQQVIGQRKGGTGLGLTICRHIVEAHLGKIWVESQVGYGATFIVTLPKNLTVDTLMTQGATKFTARKDGTPDAQLPQASV